jgi:hypothetical protein
MSHFDSPAARLCFLVRRCASRELFHLDRLRGEGHPQKSLARSAAITPAQITCEIPRAKTWLVAVPFA